MLVAITIKASTDKAYSYSIIARQPLLGLIFKLGHSTTVTTTTPARFKCQPCFNIFNCPLLQVYKMSTEQVTIGTLQQTTLCLIFRTAELKGGSQRTVWKLCSTPPTARLKCQPCFNACNCPLLLACKMTFIQIHIDAALYSFSLSLWSAMQLILLLNVFV